MLFCPPNVTFNEIWVDHGMSQCFFYTVYAAVFTTWILLFGSIKWWMYRKYATEIDAEIIPKTVLLYCQIVFSALMLITTNVRIILYYTLYEQYTTYGFMVLFFICNLICWPFSIRLIYLERHYQLPSVPTRGHGVTLLGFWTIIFFFENLSIINAKNESWWFDLKMLSDKVQFSFFVVQYMLSCLLFILGLKAPGILTANVYMSFGTHGPDIENQQGSNENEARSTWKNVWKKIKIIIPYVWPRKSMFLQLITLFCFVLLVIGRFANVLVPIYSKLIVNKLAEEGASDRFCWQYILIYVALKFLQGGGAGGMGLLNNVRSILWISVQQYTSREIQVQLFAHLHSLSLRWHLGRKTGEVLRMMDRGTSSVNQLLSYIVFSIFPTVADIIIAVAYFCAAYNFWFGFIVFCTMALYLAATIIVTEWRTKYRRSMNLTDNEQRARGVDSLLNFETVKYYGAEDYEVNRYKESVLAYQKEEWKSNASLSLLNSVQNIIINGGLLLGSLLMAWLVANNHDNLTVGDYVLFSSYIMQLYTPLNWFGTYYRMIQQSFIDMENMFDLLEEKQEVVDETDAVIMTSPKGKIEFCDVSFYYKIEKPILRNLSFVIESGKTLAIVGPSGAGKSTIMRLLFRFFDTNKGSILIDGIDIKKYTQKSLRESIGVVPQDTVLFNENILYNIRYGRVTASDEAVRSAAKNADIHDKIVTFPEEYATKVGERGLKLSGGEKQRVAIARTLLKAPSFILLDEATSALDTQTERNIQAALNRVCANKTVIVIAHRLSTIVTADCICVLKDGEIVERGSHEELLVTGGVYSDMWHQQLEANNN